jgi:hypothetical protein
MKPISSKAGALIVWVVSYIFFLFSLANNLSAAHDSISYLKDIVNGEHLFHQHHLLYHFLAHKWLLLFKPLLPYVAHHYIIESFTAVWGSGTLAICYLFFRNRFFLTNTLAFLGISIIAFSYGMWFYSVNVEVYAPPLFFIISSLYVITKKYPVSKDIWKIAFLHSLAILFHQVNILFGFVILYWMYNNRKSFDVLKVFLRYSVTGILIAGGMYLYIGWIIEAHSTATSFTSWILGYTVGHGYWEPLTFKTPFQVLTGFSRAFIGAHYIFQLPAVQTFLQESFRSHGLHDEIFLSENISPGIAWLLTVLTVVFGILFVTLIIRFFRKYSSMKLHAHVLKPLLVCLLIYCMFFIFWMPEILEFWILQMLLVWLIIIGMIPVLRFPFRIRSAAGLIVLSVSLFIINYVGSIRWLQDIRNDWYYEEVQKLKAVGPNDLVILENQWILKDYVRYYTHAKVIATDEPDFDRNKAKKEVEDVISSKGNVYLYRALPGVTSGEGEWVLIQSY